MNITGLDLSDHYIPFKESYGISSQAFAGETFLIARLHTSGGPDGLADSVNSVPFGPESPDTMRRAIFDHLLPAVIGCDPRDHVAIAAHMEKALPLHPMAKAIIDIACHDAAARAANKPLYQYLGGAVRRDIPSAGTIGLSTTARMVAEAEAHVAAGITTLKVKIGSDPATDLDRLRNIRKVIGPAIKLRVDANQGCTFDEWHAAFHQMDRLDLEFIEQPLSIHDVPATARLANELKTPILIDEGVYTPQDLTALLDAKAIGAVNIKLLKTGLTGGKEIARIAHDAGLPIVVGSMFETGIGTAASIQFAATLPGDIPATECGFPAKLEFDVIVSPKFGTTPFLSLSPFEDKPGLGVGLKPTFQGN